MVAFNVGVSLQNYFALDDFAQVDKDVNGVKTNIVGFTETLGFGLDKSIPNQYVSLTDEPLFALSKSSSDSIIVKRLDQLRSRSLKRIIKQCICLAI